MAKSPVLAVDTPSREVMTSGFWTHAMGVEFGGASYQLQSRVSDDHVLILTVSGIGWYRAGPTRGSLGSGDLLLLPPGVSHGYGTGESGSWEIIWAHLQGAGAERLQRIWTAQSDGQYVINCGLEETVRLLTAALAELRGRREAYGLAAAGYLDQAIRMAIVHVRRHRPARPAGTGADVIALQDFIHEHLGRPLTLNQLARRANLSAEHLCRVFKKATGFSPIEYLIKQRVSKAKDLLRGTHLPVAAIAREVGYDDAGYFTRTFRATTGLSPTEFRRSLLPGS